MRRAVVLAVAAGLTLSGCGDVSPGAAAVVDGTSISIEDVDDLAAGWCQFDIATSELNNEPWQPRPTSVYRDQVLSQLIHQELAEEVVEDLGLDVPAASYDVPDDPFTSIIDTMPADERDPFQRFLEVYFRVQAFYLAIHVANGGDEPTTPEEEQQASTAGLRYVAESADDRDIDLDPRFGEFTAGQVSGGSGSVSVAADVVDEPESADQPDVSGLPDSQICQ